MKIKGIILAAALLISSSAFAAESVLTNNFGSNWFIGVGGGINTAIDGVYQNNIKSGTVFGLDVNAGKWFTPSIGARIDYNGWASELDGNKADKYHAIGVSLLWDVLNTFGTYKPERIVSIVPYLQGDWIISTSRGAAAGVGIQFPIRICKSLSIVPDVHALFENGNYIYPNSNVVVCSNLFATIGLQYRIGKTQSFVTAAAFAASFGVAVAEAEAAKQEAEAALQTANEEKEAAVKANEALRNENAQLSEELAKKSAVVDRVMGTTSCVYFEIGQATLSVKELAHLDYIVKTKIGDCKCMKFTIAGNADSNTGSKARNKQLSKQRANYIVKLLTGKYGLCKDQFQVVVNGGNNIYKPVELNRAVLIDVVK